jgi:hypothetical protein
MLMSDALNCIIQRRKKIFTYSKDINTMENTAIELSQWFEEETHDAAVEMMESDAVVPFGTALWP